MEVSVQNKLNSLYTLGNIISWLQSLMASIPVSIFGKVSRLGRLTFYEYNSAFIVCKLVYNFVK